MFHPSKYFKGQRPAGSRYSVLLRNSRPCRHVLPDPARIDHIEMSPLGKGHHLEFVMIDQKNRNFTVTESFIDPQELRSAFLKLKRQSAKVRFYNLDAGAVLGREMERHLHCGAFPEIIYVCLEAQTAASDVGVGMIVNQSLSALNHRYCFGIVDFAARPHHA